MEKKQTAVQRSIELIRELNFSHPSQSLTWWADKAREDIIRILEAQLQIEEEMIKEFAENFAVQMGGALNSRNDIDDYFKANFKR